MFELNEAQKNDINLFKLFVSTCPTEPESLTQGSPFEGRAAVADNKVKEIFEKRVLWDAFTIAITQRRYPRAQPATTQRFEDIPDTLPAQDDQSECYISNGHTENSEMEDSNLFCAQLSGKMSVKEIVLLLRQHGCVDITERLNLDQCSKHPLAHGGSADVYHGILHSGTRVAIKRSRAHIPDSNDGRACLKAIAKEGYMWSKYRHPNIVETYGIVHFRGAIALVAPWMDNGTVMEYVKKRPDTNRLKLCSEIACGLYYLHQMDTMHGDLKGVNVLVSYDGVAKLHDFGTTSMKHYTLEFTGGTGTRKYTLRWAAPEVLLDEDAGTPADVYALGMTILEVITGSPPFHYISKDPAVSVAVCMGEKPRRPEAHIPQEGPYGDKLWDLLQRCWETKLQDRPSAQEAFDILSSLPIKEPMGIAVV
ncbi:hypothetical protein RhiTH_010596 [Rhizoctonia solani]